MGLGVYFCFVELVFLFYCLLHLGEYYWGEALELAEGVGLLLSEERTASVFVSTAAFFRL